MVRIATGIAIGGHMIVARMKIGTSSTVEFMFIVLGGI